MTPSPDDFAGRLEGMSPRKRDVLLRRRLLPGRRLVDFF